MTTNDTLPTPDVKKTRRWLLPSLIWVIPLTAALIGLSLVVQSVRNKGPEISIGFVSAEGIESGKTKIRFKSIEIGEVKSVSLSPDRKSVVVHAELAKEAEGFAVSDSRFWVVRPRFSAGNISGLSTLLSGSYISVDGGESRERQKSFVGLEEPPPVETGTPGKRFILQAEDAGSLDVSTPILFHRIVVGHVESIALNPDGRMVTVSAWIDAPYDEYVMENTRFWQASGVDLRLDSSGIRVNTQSLATILLGGVSFGVPNGMSPGDVAKPGTKFTLASTQEEAFKKPDEEPQEVTMDFEQSVRGLSVGATIDFRGIDLGEVTSINMVFDREKRTLIIRVGGKIFLSRLHDAGVKTVQDVKQRQAMIVSLIRHGLRAQLRSGNLLTGQLFVAVDFFPDADPVVVDEQTVLHNIPTIPGNLEEIQQQAMQIIAKLNQIPFDKLGENLEKMLVTLDATLKSFEILAGNVDKNLTPELRKALAETRKAMQTLQGSAAPDSPIQQDMRQSMQAITEASRSLKALVDALERNPESLISGKRESNAK